MFILWQNVYIKKKVKEVYLMCGCVRARVRACVCVWDRGGGSNKRERKKKDINKKEGQII